MEHLDFLRAIKVASHIIAPEPKNQEDFEKDQFELRVNAVSLRSTREYLNSPELLSTMALALFMSGSAPVATVYACSAREVFDSRKDVGISAYDLSLSLSSLLSLTKTLQRV